MVMATEYFKKIINKLSEVYYGENHDLYKIIMKLILFELYIHTIKVCLVKYDFVSAEAIWINNNSSFLICLITISVHFTIFWLCFSEGCMRIFTFYIFKKSFKFILIKTRFYVMFQFILLIAVLYEYKTDDLSRERILNFNDFIFRSYYTYIICKLIKNTITTYFTNKLFCITKPREFVNKICWKLRYNSCCYINKTMLEKYKIILTKEEYNYLLNFDIDFTWDVQFIAPYDGYVFLSHEGMHIIRVIYLAKKYPCLNDYLLNHVKFYDTKFNCTEYIRYAILSSINQAVNEVNVENYDKMIILIKMLLNFDIKDSINLRRYNLGYGYKFTLLHYVIVKYSKKKYETTNKLIFFLVSNGAKLDYYYGKYDTYITSLNLCIQYGSTLETIKYIIMLGSEINAQDNYGNTVLHDIIGSHVFSYEHTIYIIIILINESADLPKILNHSGKSAIDIVTKYPFYHDLRIMFGIGNIIRQSHFNRFGREIVKILIRAGTPIDNYFNKFKDNYDPKIKTYYDEVKNNVWKNRMEMVLFNDMVLLNYNK